MMKYYVAIGAGTIFLAIIASLALGVAEPTRMGEFTEAFEARQIEGGAALFASNCAPCHGPQGRGIEGVAPSLNTSNLYDGTRLAEISWAGTTEDFVRNAIAAGRPRASQGFNYPQRMPTWSQQFGGPMRIDQVEALTTFVMNWEESALAEGVASPEPTLDPGESVGTDIMVALPIGDPGNGEDLAESLGCTGCHILSAVGPAWLPEGDVPGIGERAETRFTQDDYTGAATSATEYLIESIIQTNVFLVEGFDANLMPQNYGQRMTAQELADIVAYLDSLR